jgi:transmembrane 9 superfamily protein 3
VPRLFFFLEEGNTTTPTHLRKISPVERFQTESMFFLLAGIQFQQLFIAILFLSLNLISCNEINHIYHRGDPVHMYFNKVGPYHNPQETYSYFSLPFCGESKNLNEGIRYAGLGAILEGHGMQVHSAMEALFKLDGLENKQCEKVLTAEEAKIFENAVLHHYWYQMYIDDLPVWGMVGEVYDHPTMEEKKAISADVSGGIAATSAGESGIKDSDASIIANEVGVDKESRYSVYVYTHKKLSIAYNDHHIVEVNLTSEDPRLVKEGAILDFRYDVKFISSPEKSFEKRFERYLDYSFFEHQIHWFSIFNSFMMVIFLVGLVALILIRK